jgi:hypothetical protein
MDPLSVLLVLILVAPPAIFIPLAASRRKKAVNAGTLILADKTNALSIVGFVVVFFAALPGIIVSHVALAQIKKSNERGWGLAVAGLWIGYPLFVLSLGFTVGLIVWTLIMR